MRFFISNYFLSLLLCTIFGYDGGTFMLHSSFADTGKTQVQSHNLQHFDIRLDVEKYQLDNALTILLHVDKRIPYIHHLLMVKVGSVDEVEGKTGLAHLFEHMMFRGTERFSGDEYDKKLNKIGGLNNAFTGRDMTAYYVHFPKQHLEMVLDLESDRLQNLQINQSVFEKELEVVKEERRLRTDNDPGDFFEPMMKLVYPIHPYGRPILGWMSDLEKMSVPDLEKFYQTYYAPEKAVLVLAGDFNKAQAKKLIQKYYGPLHRSQYKATPKSTTKKDAKKIKRFIKYQRSIQGPTLAFGFRVPAAGTKHSYDLDIASHVLTGGQSSRLQKLLVYDRRLALSAQSFYYGMKQKGVFIIAVKLSPKASPVLVKKLVFEEIKKLSLEPVSDKELLKSQRSTLQVFIASIKSLDDKANALGENELLFGDYKDFFKDLDRYRKVTAKRIQKSVSQYLQKEQSFIVQLVPKQQK